MNQDAPEEPTEQGKKPYVKPELVELGSVVELTRGSVTAAATDDNRLLHS